MIKKKASRKINKKRLVSIIKLIIWITTMILHYLYKESEDELPRLIPIIILAVWLAYESAIGLVLKPKFLEPLWILLFSSLFLFLGYIDEAITTVFIFLFIWMAIQFFIERIEPYGEKFNLSLQDFSSDYEDFIRYNNILVFPLSIIIGGIVFFLNKEILELALYAIGLSLIALSSSFFPIFLMSLSFVFMIKLARRGIYHQDSKNLKNNFYDFLLMEDEGILTDGKYEIATILPLMGYSEEEIIELSAYAFYNSSNPIRKVFLKKYGKKILHTLISNFQEDKKFGISLVLADDTYRIGKAPLLSQIGRHPQEPDTAQVIYYLLRNGEEIASIELISHMCDNITNPIEQIRSHHVSKIICFTGENRRLTRRAGNGYGIEVLNVEDEEKKREVFNALSGKILYIDGSDESRQFDFSNYPLTSLHIGEDLREDRDYDIWMPHGSLQKVCHMMDDAKDFVSLRNKLFVVYFALKLILTAFIISLSIRPLYIMVSHMIIIIFMIFMIITNREEEKE